jgi:hypothetical protein
MSELSPGSGVKQKSRFGVVRAAFDQLGHRDISRLIHLNKRYSLIAYITAG